MDGASLDRSEIGACHFWPDLPVEGVAGFQSNFFAFADLCHGWDVRMIAVVADMRLFCERLAPIDPDRLHLPPP